MKAARSLIYRFEGLKARYWWKDEEAKAIIGAMEDL